MKRKLYQSQFCGGNEKGTWKKSPQLCDFKNRLQRGFFSFKKWNYTEISKSFNEHLRMQEPIYAASATFPCGESPGPGLPRPLLSTHFITCYTRTILRYMATTEGRTNNYGKYVSIDIVYLTLQDLKKKHVYTYCLSTVYRAGAQYKLESRSVFLSKMTQNVRKASFRLPKVCFCSWLELIFWFAQLFHPYLGMFSFNA